MADRGGDEVDNAQVGDLCADVRLEEHVRVVRRAAHTRSRERKSWCYSLAGEAMRMVQEARMRWRARSAFTAGSTRLCGPCASSLASVSRA